MPKGQRESLNLNQDQEAYLAWLLTPEIERVPSTKTAWAEQNGVHQNTLNNGEKKKDPH